MLPRTRILFLDALNAGRHILRTIERYSAESFDKDQDAQLIVERCFEIVGEAIRILDGISAPELAEISDYRAIISLRNVIAHQYAVINPSRIWQIANENLPVTVEEIQAVLDAHPE
jgi:uncharacterized protein with HEPN domain